ncbi:transcript variant X2 [Nothobranchius furzeri]|uniref:Transcript variant X2 n=2 Tax=Nothobranchius furzeri TaxID=105023 RepID=A0A9D2XCL3_NOTFU|nr:transcript variant X2 [Nothobranchius furzeri]
MAAQVEVQTGDVAGGRPHLSPLTDSSNKSLIEIPSISESHFMSSESDKPVTNPKPRFTPKPFVVDKNPTIKPILAPKPRTKPRPESTRLAGFKPDLPNTPKPTPRQALTHPNRPAPTIYKTSNKLNTGQTNKPVVQPFKAAPSFDLVDISKPTRPVPSQRHKPAALSLADSKGLKTLPAAEWSGTTTKENDSRQNRQNKEGPSITRAKSTGFLAEAVQEEENQKVKTQLEVSALLRPQSRGSRPRPVSAIFPGTPTKTEMPVPSPQWTGRRPLSADLTSKFESVGLSLHRKSPMASSKENTPTEKKPPLKTEQDKSSQSFDGLTNLAALDKNDKRAEESIVKNSEEEKHMGSIKSRISLFLDSSPSLGTGTTGQDTCYAVQPVPETEPAVGVKKLIKQLTEDVSPTQSPVVKPVVKPRPLPLDLTKRFSSETSPDLVSGIEDLQEISKDPQRGAEESALTPNDQMFLDLRISSDLLKKASTPECSETGLRWATFKEDGADGEVHAVRASLFENVVERQSVLVMDQDESANTTRGSLNNILLNKEDSEDEGTLVTATYKEPISPSSPFQVFHAFDTLQAVEENKAVVESVPTAKWEDKAMTLHTRRSEVSRSTVERSDPAQVQPKSEQQPRYLRIGALKKWTTTSFDQETGVDKGMLNDSDGERQVALDNDGLKAADQDEMAAAPKRPKMLQAEEQSKPRATYFALTGQMQESGSVRSGGTIFGDMSSLSDDVSVRSALGGSQGKTFPVRRNQSVKETFGSPTQSHNTLDELMQRSHALPMEIRSQTEEKTKEEIIEAEKKRELTKEAERHRAKMRELEKEKRKLLEMEKHQMEWEMQREFERQRRNDFEKEKQELEEKLRGLEKLKQIELEKQKRQELEKKKKEIEKERQQQLLKDKQQELERREQEREREREKEKQRQKEYERQRQLDKERQIVDMERQQVLEFQKQKQKEKERQQLVELEKLRLKEKEAERLRQMALEQERFRIKELEKEKARQTELEVEHRMAIEREKQRDLDIQRQRDLEREHQRQLDIERQQLETEKQRREQEKERKRKEDLESLKEMERRQLLEFEKLKQANPLELEKQRLEEKMEKEEVDKIRQVAKQQEAERQRLKEKQKEEEQERIRLVSSAMRPKVLDLDSVLRSDQPSSPRCDPSTRWREPYKPVILDIDSFTSQTQASPSKDLFPVSGIRSPDAESRGRLQPTPEKDVNWQIPLHASVGFSAPVWTTSLQDPWELRPVETAVVKPVAEPNKPASRLTPEQVVSKQEERLQTLQRLRPVLPDEPPVLAPSPGIIPETGNSPHEVSTSTSGEQIWIPGELQPPQNSRETVASHRKSHGSQELNRFRSRSMVRRSAPSSSAVDASLPRMRSRSAHRGEDCSSLVQQKQSSEDKGKSPETPFHDTDSQYGTWETGLRSDDSLTPATPSSESNLSLSSRRPAPHSPAHLSSDTLDGAPVLPSSESQPLPFPDAPIALLDNSVLRSRAQLGKKRAPRTRPSKASHLNSAQIQEEGGNTEDWLYRDSTEPKAQFKDLEPEEKIRGADPGPAVVSQPQRVALFPGVDPSALKAQLKKRSDSETDGPIPSPSQPSRSPKSPFLPRAARVLPPPGVKENSEEDSPQWLKELKSKKRLSQYESET